MPEGWSGPLPEAVRHRVVAVAADTLGELAPEEVPAMLRRVASFAPARRARAGGTALAAALAADDGFRRRVETRARAADPALAAALDAGQVPAAADPVDVAATAYLVRPPGWSTLVAAAAAELGRLREHQAEAAIQAQLDDALRRAEDDAARAAREVAAARADAEAARAEAADLRRDLRARTGEARRAQVQAAELSEQVAAAKAARDEELVALRAQVRRLEDDLARAGAERAAERRAAREGRSLADRDARLLLDTLLGAARGLERELALPPALGTPADDVAAAVPGDAGGGPGAAGSAGALALGGGLAPDDPAFLERLLALPRAHLIVDAYNVTKTAYGDAPLVDQRRRLVTGLAALAARTAAEVTAVFDGAAVGPLPPASWPRRVRVLFSPPGETADAVVLRLVSAEPPGRAVVVASSDREVATGALSRGAWSVPSVTLARLLERGQL